MALLTLVSCSKVQDRLPAAPVRDGECLVTVTCTPEEQTAILTRGLTPEEESRIDDVNLFAFHSATGTTKHVFLQSGNTASFSLFAGQWEFYAVANMNYNMKKETVQSLTVTYLSVSSEDALTGSGLLRMTARKSVEIGAGTTSVHLELVRLAARVEVDVRLAPDVQTMNLLSVQALNIPISARYFGDNNAIRFFEGEVHESTDNATLSHTFYLPENLAGTVSSVTDPQERNPFNAPETALCFLIRAVYQGRNVSYAVYPGENGTSDFNLRRNHNYMMNVTICGANPEDVRVDNFELALDYPAENVYVGQTIPLELIFTANSYEGNSYKIDYMRQSGSCDIVLDSEKLPAAGTIAAGLTGTSFSSRYALTLTPRSTAPVQISFTVKDSRGEKLVRVLTLYPKEAKQIDISVTYNYGVERTILSDYEQMLQGVVSVTVIASELLPLFLNRLI